VINSVTEDANQVGGKKGEIQSRARVCKILEIADADGIGHPPSSLAVSAYY
jgi:hypothetical protein